MTSLFAGHLAAKQRQVAKQEKDKFFKSELISHFCPQDLSALKIFPGHEVK